MKNTFTLLHSLLLVCALIFIDSSASGATLSPGEALARVSGQSSRKMRAKISSQKFTLYHTEKIDDTPALYLFVPDATHGMMLVSADDASLPLLGYSESCILPESEQSLPPAFKYWMQTLARQVAYNGVHNLKASAQTIVGEAIQPLTATRWNQDLPFNYYCPIAGDKHCYTGCVATALAQIMKYHNYPAKGTGRHSYGWKNPSTEKDTTLAFNYADTEFKWDMMVDRYDRETPWNSKMAVAELMYACGVAVDMGYGPWSSGAGTNMIGPAMINYFGYDKGVRNYIRDYYGLDDWNRLVYTQLKEFGPVQYSGFGDTDGHSFIIDGYNEEGYFHVNWGWGGMSDGYFLLTALDPLEQGIGGAEQAFDFSQDFVGNVSTGGKSTSIYEQILLDNAFGLEQTSAKPGDKLHIWGGSFNYSAGAISDIMFGAMLISDAGADTLHLEGPSYATLAIGDGVRPYDVKLPEDVPAGSYRLVPAFRNSRGVWCEIPVKIGYNNHYNAVSTGETVTFTQGGHASIKATDIQTPESVKSGEKFDVTATLRNETDSEFFGSVCVALYSVNEPEVMIVKSAAVPVDVLSGEDFDFSYQAQFNPADDMVKSATYALYICHVQNGKLTKISAPIDIVFDDIKTEAGNISASQVEMEYYTLEGVKLNGKPSTPGIYIKGSSKGKEVNRVVAY